MEVGAVFLYGSGGWTLTKEQANSLKAWEGWCWREMLGYPKQREGETPEEYKRKRYEAAKRARAEEGMEGLVARYLSIYIYIYIADVYIERDASRCIRNPPGRFYIVLHLLGPYTYIDIDLHLYI